MHGLPIALFTFASGATWLQWQPTLPDAQAWLASAQSVEGSWWPAWSDWLRAHAGALVAAPRQAGNAAFAPIEAAPGRYVRTPAA